MPGVGYKQHLMFHAKDASVTASVLEDALTAAGLSRAECSLIAVLHRAADFGSRNRVETDIIIEGTHKHLWEAARISRATFYRAMGTLKRHGIATVEEVYGRNQIRCATQLRTLEMLLEDREVQRKLKARYPSEELKAEYVPNREIYQARAQTAFDFSWRTGATPTHAAAGGSRKGTDSAPHGGSAKPYNPAREANAVEAGCCMTPTAGSLSSAVDGCDEDEAASLLELHYLRVRANFSSRYRRDIGGAARKAMQDIHDMLGEDYARPYIEFYTQPDTWSEVKDEFGIKSEFPTPRVLQSYLFPLSKYALASLEEEDGA
jgi:hypothetical protein